MDYTLEHPARQAHARLIHEEALALASLGLRVVPLHPDSKQPAIRHWQRRATRNPDRVPTLFPDGASLNLGVCIGRRHVVIDIDPRNGGLQSFAELTEEYGHPPTTAMSWTAGGGFHLLFGTKLPIHTRMNLLPGIDVLGANSLMTVPPSRLDELERHYDWCHRPETGIALLPDWLAKRIDGTARSHLRGEGRPLVTDRTSDPRRLATELIERFPVEGYGRRHSQMVRAIGSLLGRGYRPDVVFEAMEAWHVHVLGRGTTRTSIPAGLAEVEATIHATLGNAKFHAAVGVVNHQAALAEIHLTEEQERLIQSGVITSDGVKERGQIAGSAPPRGTPLVIGLTQIDCIGKRLCESRDEEAYVTSLLILATHVLPMANDGRIRMTDAQVGAIAAQRFDGIKWGPQQVERLKRKYLTRPADDKPATKFELMRELVKGRRKSSEAAGTPSEYLPTGLLALLPESVTIDLAARTGLPNIDAAA